MKEEVLAEVVNNTTTKEVAGQKKSEGAQNPKNRAYVVYFDGIGFLCDKEKNASCVTQVVAEASVFDSYKVAQRFMGFFPKFDSDNKLVDNKVLMYVR